jgi:acid phosphatase type 7
MESRVRITAAALLGLLAACATDQMTRPSKPSFIGTEPAPILIGAGDIAGCTLGGKDKLTAHVIDSVLRVNPSALAFTAGDNVYDKGTLATWGCYDASWGVFKAKTWFTLGNHEYKKDSTAHVSFDYILGAGVDSAENGVRGKGYHVHDVGTWRVYFLNSEKNIDEQTAWLTQDLAANPRLCQMLVFHRPLHSPAIATGGGGDLEPARELRPWHMAFWAAKGDVIVNGHHHFYRSTLNIRPDTTPGVPAEATVRDTGGYRLFIEGGGGQKQLNLFPPQTGYDRKRIRSWGVLKLTLRTMDYSWQRLDTLGRVVDHGFRGCH